MRWEILRPQNIHMHKYTSRFLYLYDFLPMFPRENESNKMEDEDINTILIRYVTNGRDKQAYIQAFDFEF